MHHVRQENLPFVGSSHEFVGAEQGDTGVSVFLFMESRVRDRARTGTPMTRFSLFVKAGECGRSTAKLSRAAREISLSLRQARSIVSRRLVTRRWYKSTFTSVLASSKRTCRVEAPSVHPFTVAMLAPKKPR